MYSSMNIKGRGYKTKAILQSGTLRAVSTALPTLLSQRAPAQTGQSLTWWEKFQEIYATAKNDFHHMANFVI